MTQFWPAPTTSRPVHATVDVPGSKSITNRALVLAALATGPSTLHAPLRSRDTELMATALRALGTEIVDGTDQDWFVTPHALRGPADIDCGLAGTVMRFLPPVAALADGRLRFDGDPRARERPLDTVLTALRQLGADVRGDALPFDLHGRGTLTGGTVTIDASASSQFVSGLLLSAPRFEHGVTVIHDGGAVPSTPHIDMTVAMLRAANVDIADDRPNTWQVAPGPVQALDLVIEPDLSNATPFLAAAAVTGGSVTIPRWPARTTQAGDMIREILREMGAEVTRDAHGLTVTGPERLRGVDLDLGRAGELAPTVTALAALADTPTQLRGIAHLRGHETDRLAALERELTRLGGRTRQTEDGLIITPAPLRGGSWHSYADHRMATAGAILGLRVPDIEIEDIDTTAKTLPGFDELWTTMVETVAS